MFVIQESQEESQRFKRLIGILGQLMTDTRLSGRDVRVILAVLALGGGNDGRSAISMVDVGRLTGIAYNDVCKIVGRLDSLGWIYKISGNGRGKISTINICIS